MGYARKTDVIAILLAFAAWGCVPPAPAPTPGGGDTGGNVSLAGTGVTAREPDDSFAQATPVTLDPSGTTHLVGTITAANKLDIFNVGTFQAGDRIIVDVGAQSNGLDADAAIFDLDGKLVNENDDRNANLQQLDPFINHIIRHDSTYFIAVAVSPFADPTASTGAYDAIVTVTRGGQVPATSGQIVALNVAGGTVTIGGSTFTATPFNPADIDPRYAGDTALVLDQIVTTMAQNYEGLELQIKVIPRDQAQIPAGCSASTILLGGFNARAFGISAEIDHYDANKCDGGIVFTDSFSPAVFGRLLTPTELGTAIGNVTAHELGHLLGLNHVDNVRDLMDTTGAADTLLQDQMFMTSPLDGTIFPIGVQDGVQLLQETLGIAPP
jgi:hypothetical protein